MWFHNSQSSSTIKKKKKNLDIVSITEKEIIHKLWAVKKVWFFFSSLVFVG